MINFFDYLRVLSTHHGTLPLETCVYFLNTSWMFFYKTTVQLSNSGNLTSAQYYLIYSLYYNFINCPNNVP